MTTRNQALSALAGVKLHKAPPEGEPIGRTLELFGETFYVTQAEIDRVNNMPDADEARAKIQRWTSLVSKALKPPVE